jgi:hypothetical protein
VRHRLTAGCVREVFRECFTVLVTMVDTHLQYLGWALSDKSPGVRGKAVAAIAALYEDR